MKEKSRIGLRIKELREEKKMTQAEFSEILGFAPATVSGIERSKQLPTFEFLAAMHEEFGVSTDEILLGEKAEIEKSRSSSSIELAFREREARIEELQATIEELRSTVNFLKKTLDFFMRRQSDEPDAGKLDSGNVQGLTLNSHYQRCARESSRVFAVTA